ncbi:MAG: hypothetical protein R8J85_02740 [Mariprofundales bacterium]
MSEGSIEHRTNFRPPTPMPGISARMDSAMETLAKKKQWNLVAHGGMALFVLICIAIVWWSISFRLPQLQQDSVGIRQANQLRNQVEQLRLRENLAIEEGVLKSMDVHEKELFVDRKAVVDWLKDNIDAAQQQGVSLHYTLGGVSRALMTHHVMGITLRLGLTRTSKRSSFARLIRFVERMRHHGTTLHIERLSMHGSGHGVTTMNLQATVWML